MKKIFLIFCILSVSSVFGQEINVKKELTKINKLADDNFNVAIKYADSLLHYNFDGKGKLFSETAYLYLRINNYKKALSYFNKSKALLIKENNKKELAYAFFGLGEIYSSQNKKEKAIQMVMQGNEIGSKIKNSEVLAHSFSLLANIYYKLNDFNKAITYSKKAAVIKLNQKDFISLSSTYNNIAVYYEKMNKLGAALIYQKKALNLVLSASDTSNMYKYRTAIFYNNIGKTNYKMHNYATSIINYKNSIKLHQQIQSNNINPYKNLALLYLEQNKLDLAKKNFILCLNLLKKGNRPKELEEIYSLLLNLSLKQKNIENTLLYQQKRDSLNSINNVKANEEKINLIDSQYKQALREKQLEQKIEINKKDNIIYGILLTSLLLFGLFLYQKNNNAKLILQKEKLILEQKVLRSQMNPHFIFNALTSIQKNLLEDDILKSSTSLSKFAKLIRQNFEFISKKYITLDEDLDMLKNYIETQQLRFDNKFEYEINIQKDLDISYIQIPPMLLQPFVENAIEHGLRPLKEKGNLIINIIEVDEYIRFEIIDNGVGYQLKEKATDREHATDIFLKRLKLRNLGEEKLFSINKNENKKGMKVIFLLKL